MHFILSESNAKIFSKAINTIARFGDVYFEPEADGLYLKSINNSKSAYITIKFFKNFFNDYRLNSMPDSFDGKCKVSIKALLNIFKNMKNVDQCKISSEELEEKISIEINCKLDTRKKYALSIADIETLEPGNIGDVRNKNKIEGSTKIFSDISNNFQMAEEEITLEAEKSRLIIKNYFEGQAIDSKFMRTQYKLKGEEFDQYNIKNESTITFCLREFRALLNFAEFVNSDCSLLFENPGMPVVFKICNLSVFEANLFMSTLSPDDMSNFDENERRSENPCDFLPEDENYKNKVDESNRSLKGAKSLFQRCFDGSSLSSESGVILAVDSEEEDNNSIT